MSQHRLARLLATLFVVGAPAIAQLVGGTDMKASPVTWSADTASGYVPPQS